MSYTLTGVTVSPGSATFDGIGTPISETLDYTVHCQAGDPLPGQIDIHWDDGAGITTVGPGLNPPGSVAPADGDYVGPTSAAQTYSRAGVWAIRVVVTDCNGVVQLDTTLVPFTLTGPGPTVTTSATTSSGFAPLEPGLHFHVDVGAAWGARPASWSVDLGAGGAPLAGTLVGPGPHDVDLTGADGYPLAGVYIPTVAVTADDGSVTAADFPSIDVLAVFVTPAGAATSDSQATGTVVMRPRLTSPPVDLSGLGFTLDELPDPVAYPSTLLPVRQMALDRAPWTIKDGIAVDPPLLGAMSRSVAYSRSNSYSEDLANQVALGLQGATARWLPDPADIAGSNWNPHFGAAPAFAFSGLAPAPPYVDPDYWYYGRHERRKTVSAMVFDGTSWATFASAASQPAFTWLVVAVLHHPASRAYYDILASPSALTDPDRATDAALRYENGYVRAYAPARLGSALTHPPTYRHRTRPVMIAFGADAHRLTLGVIDGLGRHWAEPAHPTRASYDLRMKLGMNGGVNDVSYAAEMDVLDVLYWSSRRSAIQLANVVTALDGAYGVTGR